jgi:shikimate kinase
MACGKSTVGRLVAEGTAARFVDLDDRIEEAAGMPLAALIEKEGESAFRRLERQQVARVLDLPPAADECWVVALGGGGLLDSRLRARALDETFVVALSARADTIAARVTASASPSISHVVRRPLVDGADWRDKIEHLLKRRAPAYDETHAAISTDDRTPSQVAEELIHRWRGWRHGS